CPYVLRMLYGSMLVTQVCDDRERLSCMQQLAALGTGLTPALVHQCAQERKGRGCVEYAPLNACQPLGMLADGANCWTPAQCAGGTCLLPIGASCGKCAKLSPLDGPCYTNLDCQNPTGNWCRGVTQTSAGTCTGGNGLGTNCSVLSQMLCQNDL